MNLRSIRPASNNLKPTDGPDPKEPHLFQETIPGGVCALCTRSKSDRVHQGVEVDEPPRWGF